MKEKYMLTVSKNYNFLNYLHLYGKRNVDFFNVELHTIYIIQIYQSLLA